jgi:uncharacterized membrane protein YeaQ/YmgE (transglycosylase-associated protein family)
MGAPIGIHSTLANHYPKATHDNERRRQMAVLGWFAVGLVTSVLATGFRRSDEARGVVAGRYATGVVGALIGGLVAVAAGVGSIGEFFDARTWFMALGGAVVAVFVYELVGSPRERRKNSGGWGGRAAGGESESLDRNW